VKLAAQPGVVFDHARPTPDVHGRIVPRRNHLRGFSLCRVPGGRYVVLRTLEDDHAFLHGRQLSPLTVRARQMAPDGAELRSVRVDQTWNPVGHQASGTGGDDQPERVGTNQTVLNVEPILTKIRRLVHANSSGKRVREYTKFSDFNADFRSNRLDLIGPMPGEDFPDPGFSANPDANQVCLSHYVTRVYRFNTRGTRIAL